MGSVRDSMWTPEFDMKYLKKAEGHIGRNVVSIHMKMGSIARIFIACNKFSAKVISVSQKYLLLGYSKWRHIKPSTSGLNRGLPSTYCYKPCVIHCVIRLEKHVLVKRAKHEFESKRQSMKGKHTDSSERKISGRLVWFYGISTIEG